MLLVISLGFSGIALYFALRGADLPGVAKTVRSMSVAPLIAALFLLGLGTFVRALRWHVLLRRSGSTLPASLEAVLVSVFFTGVLPFRAGEPMRVLYFSKRTGAPLFGVSAALLVERALDLATLGVLAGVLAWSRPGLREAVGHGRLLFAVAILLLALCYAAIRAVPALQARLQETGRAPRLLGALQGVRLGLAALQTRGEVLLVTALSFLMWLLAPLPSRLVFEAAGSETSYRDNLFILLAVAVAVSLPSSPGFVGTFHGGFVLAAVQLGIQREVALSAAVVTHFLGQIPFIAAGAAVFASQGRRLIVRTDPAAAAPAGRSQA